METPFARTTPLAGASDLELQQTLLDGEANDEGLLSGGGRLIKPLHFSRFLYNITPWCYRVSREQYTWFAARKARQRRAAAAAAHRSSSAAAAAFLPPVLPPTHPLVVAWSVALLLVDLTYTAILLPLAFAFSLNEEDQWRGVSVALGALFTLDFGVMLHRGVVVRWMDRLIYVDGRADVAWAYATYGDFALGLVVALSAPAQLLAIFLEDCGVVSEAQLGIIQVLVLVRGLRLLRLLVLQRSLFFGKPAVRHAAREVLLCFLSLLYVLAVLLTWLASMMLAIAHHEQASVSWLASVKGQDLTNAPPMRQFIAAIYFVTVTACTVGYGDISGGTAMEQLAVVLTVVVGVTFIGFSVKSMVDVLLEAALQDENAQRIALLRDRGRALSTWSRWQSSSQEVLDQVLSFYLGPGVEHEMVAATWGRLMAELPAELRGRVLMQVLFRSHPEMRPLGERLLAGVDPEDAIHALAQLEVAPLCMGHALCFEGDTADSVWLLQEGELVTLVGVLPRGSAISGPALVAPFDLAAWLEHQRDQELAGAPPHAHTHPQHQLSLQLGQAVSNCFLFRIPLSRLALVVRCLPAVRDNLAAYFAGGGIDGSGGGGGGGSHPHMGAGGAAGSGGK